MFTRFFGKKKFFIFFTFSGMIFIAAGVFIYVGFYYENDPIVLGSPQWTQEIGSGISVPACASASATATCSETGAPVVAFNWSYDGEHGACASAQIRFLYEDGPVKGGVAYGVINNKLYVAQGRGTADGSYFDAAALSWSSIANAPAGATAPASAVANGRLYSFEAATYEYDPSTNIWATRAPPPVDFTWGQAATVNNVIYVFQGVKNYAYDLTANSWTQKANPPRSHGNWPAVAQVNGIIYVIGGSSTGAVDAYDPASNTWTQKTTIPAPLGYKGYATAGAYNNKIYVFGGGDWDGPTAELWEYDPSGDTWARKKDMPTIRNVPAVGVIKNRIAVYGGIVPGDVYSDIYRYDPASDSYGHITGLACPPQANSYIWDGGIANKDYAYVVEILRGNEIISSSAAGAFTTPNCVLPFDFSMSNGGDKSVAQGDSVTNSVIATLISDTTQSVSFSASGLPSGATASFSPTDCRPTCSTVMTINTLGSTPIGGYNVTVHGTYFGGVAFKDKDQNIAAISEVVIDSLIGDSLLKIQRIISNLSFY